MGREPIVSLEDDDARTGTIAPAVHDPVAAAEEGGGQTPEPAARPRRALWQGAALALATAGVILFTVLFGWPGHWNTALDWAAEKVGFVANSYMMSDYER